MFKRENPAYMISFEKVNFGLCSDIYRPISIKLGMMIEYT